MSALLGFLARSAGWLIAIIGFLVEALLITWATLAIYYSNLPWAWARIALAATFALFAIWALWLSRRRNIQAAAAVLFLGVVGWWLELRRRSLINEAAQAADGSPDFSERIRAALPPR